MIFSIAFHLLLIVVRQQRWRRLIIRHNWIHIFENIAIGLGRGVETHVREIAWVRQTSRIKPLDAPQTNISFSFDDYFSNCLLEPINVRCNQQTYFSHSTPAAYQHASQMHMQNSLKFVSTLRICVHMFLRPWSPIWLHFSRAFAACLRLIVGVVVVVAVRTMSYSRITSHIAYPMKFVYDSTSLFSVSEMRNTACHVRNHTPMWILMRRSLNISIILIVFTRKWENALREWRSSTPKTNISIGYWNLSRTCASAQCCLWDSQFRSKNTYRK